MADTRYNGISSNVATSPETPVFRLDISPSLVDELHRRGMRKLGDLATLTSLEAIHIRWMNGQNWTAICKALGKKPYG